MTVSEMCKIVKGIEVRLYPDNNDTVDASAYIYACVDVVASDDKSYVLIVNLHKAYSYGAYCKALIRNDDGTYSNNEIRNNPRNKEMHPFMTDEMWNKFTAVFKA